MGYAPAPVLNDPLSISRGLVAGMSYVSKFGRNPDVDTGSTPEDIWSQGGIWVPPTTARLHNVVSTSANDTSAGTGARTITVYGLNGSYVETSETVTLNGTTPVATANSYVIIHRALVATAGSGATNAGDITFTAQTDATITCAIVAGYAQTQLGVYQVPAGKTAYISQVGAGIQGGASAQGDVCLFIKPFGGVYSLKLEMSLSVPGSSMVRHVFPVPIAATAKSLIKLMCTNISSNNTDIHGTFDLVLVDS